MSKVVEGQCSTPTLQENFDATKYTGRWFEIQRDDQPFEKNYDCQTANYALNEDGSLKVKNN